MRRAWWILCVIALCLVCLAPFGWLMPGVRTQFINMIPLVAKARVLGVQVNSDIAIFAPDGVRLRATLYRPSQSDHPLPTVLIRLPYGRDRYEEAVSGALFFARHGYAALVVDLRGSGDSGGEMLPWRDADTDGRVTLDWIVRQPWSNGRVGGYGCSALGETQLVLSRIRHPAFKAMIPSGAGGGVGSAAGRFSPFGVFEGGIFQLASGFGWFTKNGSKVANAAVAESFDVPQHLRRLPVASLVREVRAAPTAYDDFLLMPLSDPKWAEWGYLTNADVPSAAALVINTWGDQTVGDTLALAELWRRKGVSQKVIIAPGDHCQHTDSGQLTHFGALPVSNAQFDWKDWYLRFFDAYLLGRGEGVSREAAYTYFMLVDNRWYQADAWPPVDAVLQRWYLASDGQANTRAGDGRLILSPPVHESSDGFTYDPRNPVPTRGGPVCCTGDARVVSGPADQSDVEDRRDVLVYTSDPMVSDVKIAGPLRAQLRVSSSALDTDLIARLTHVWPDGRSTNIQEGALRLRYRDGIAAPKLLKPNEVVTATIDMRSIAYKVPKGHRLRLQLTSSSFPRLERNLNTGATNNAQDIEIVVAHNQVFHGPTQASWLELPVLQSRE